MFKNIILVTVASLMRKKMASVFTLLTIVLGMTLVILLVSTYNSYTGDVGPCKNRTKSLFVSNLKFKKDGEVVQRLRHKNATTSFINDYVSQLEDKALIGVYGINYMDNLGSKYNPYMIQTLTTDANFWKIYEFDFLSGKAFTPEQVRDKEHVCILSEKAAKWLFQDTDVAGKSFENAGKTYRVAGVVASEHEHFEVAADLYIPYSIAFWNESWTYNYGGEKVYIQRGRLKAVVLPKPGVSKKEIRDDYRQIIAKLNSKGSVEEFDEVISTLNDASSLITQALGINNYEDDGTFIYWLIGLFVLALPVITLSNINFYSLRDRFEEIGVRKAFGATRKAIVKQFLAENVILTFCGTLVAIFTSYGISILVGKILYNGGAIPGFSFSFRLVFLLVAGLLLFSFLTIIFPVWRISKAQPIQALQMNQGNQLFRFKSRKKWLQISTFGMLIFILIVGSYVLISVHNSNKGLGFNPSNIVVIMVDEKDSFRDKHDLLKHRNQSHEYNQTRYKGLSNAIARLEGVESVSNILEHPPYYIIPQFMNYKINGEEKKIRSVETDDQFWNVVKIKAIKGKLYGNAIVRDGFLPAVVNKKAEKDFWNGDAIGKTFIRESDGKRIMITGVINSYKNFAGRRSEAKVFMQRNAPSRSLAIRYSSKNINVYDLEKQIVATINKWSGSSVFITRNMNIEVPFKQDMQQSLKMYGCIKIGMILLLLNAFMGYFTLNYFSVDFRQKEFGLRQAVGATKYRTLRAIIWENIRLVVWGGVIFGGILIQYLFIVANNRMGQVWEALGMALTIAAVLSFSTIIVPAVRAIRKNAVEALADE